MKTGYTVAVIAALALSGGLPLARAQPATQAEPEDGAGQVAATATTRQANAAVAKSLADDDRADFKDAERGLIARDPNLVIADSDGHTVWDMTAYDFIEGDAPDTVNPSLWRQAKLNDLHGLYKVTDRVYQLRGYDLSNMSLIEGDSGWIVVDPLTTAETAAAGWRMAKAHILGDKPIVAVIFTHSHIDHFGGIEGVLTAEQAKRDNVRIIAPKGFMAESTSENLLAGPAMGRRATYMYGGALARGPRGHVDSGLGKAPSKGHFSILAPTDIIDHTGQTLTVDGLEFDFQYAPESEAPAELTFYLPQVKAFCGAEIVSHTLHNIYTLRGAKVRDALKWSDYIDEALQLYGNRAEVVFNSHHWPVWGHDTIVNYLKIQRDTYKYIHDQTLRMANAGYTPREIAEQLTLPESLAKPFHNRGYYGTVSHDSKAVYQWYFGWFDGNPANLDPLPPTEAAKKYVEFMGGADAVVDKAQQSYDAGEYRWTAEVLNQVVFAEPDNDAAKALLAKTYDQLGYRAQSGPWRDVYLTGAKELRDGAQGTSLDMSRGIGLLRQVPIERFFDAMAARLNGPEAAKSDLTINFDFKDLGENHVLTIENGVLHHWKRPLADDANATVHLTHPALLALIGGKLSPKQLKVDGDRASLGRFFSLLQAPDRDFAIVTP
ncbi:alkyl sulfatase dimerization domain-containing protein [Salinisphaera sp. T31B1]|uniref:alkyl/aryl-sulfatase n=1 Tax=Salinisphaera sp. T31B1 TaxID=727963 RepID=UPI00333E7802